MLYSAVQIHLDAQSKSVIERPKEVSSKSGSWKLRVESWKLRVGNWKLRVGS